MLHLLIPGWSAEQLEAHAALVLDRNGLLVCLSRELGRLLDTPALPLGTPRRPLQPVDDSSVQPAIENWVSFILSGALARLGVSSGEIDIPRWSSGTVRCHWQYFGIPDSDPDYHLLIFEPFGLAEGAQESLARQALRMESALFEIRSVVDGVGLAEPRREPPEPLDLSALTEREFEVVKLLLEGRSNDQTARQLHVSLETVKSHAKAIYKKLSVHSRAELLARFVTSPGVLGLMLPLF